ncbi:hypothetical protein E1176_18225 [Fulvivirga sp. RKSG066]|uniref:PepSY domain-containing protein n=1 Tax=Fulvivirga aurantia TaxID=2529383 RepID=UPI0012BBF401|nr:PepSY domain-containing protein [Fulvivirga aurantia]MTI22973.1 hypothetical protein [Fulvivirga aurantia]
MRKNNQYYIRKTHRWLGVIIGIQFIFWTISGLYFSWTDIDEIHGDHFLEPVEETAKLGKFDIPDSLLVGELALRLIDGKPYLWVNNSLLFNTDNGQLKQGVTKDEAERIARKYVKDDFQIVSSSLITEVGAHHEYRGRPLPAWAVKFDNSEELTAYISQRDGSFQRVRHQSWRWFDFLWMFHTMDYQGRDDFNNLLLRAFSLFGLFTVASGFTLFFMTTKKKRKRNLKPKY